MYPEKVISKETLEKTYFFWHLVSHRRKKQVADPDLYVNGTDLGIRIRTKMSRIHNIVFKSENWRGMNLLERRVGCTRCQETVRVRTQALPSLHTHTA
jgi:hypothetical protein